jgi:hypothetical protein
VSTTHKSVTTYLRPDVDPWSALQGLIDRLDRELVDLPGAWSQTGPIATPPDHSSTIWGDSLPDVRRKMADVDLTPNYCYLTRSLRNNGVDTSLDYFLYLNEPHISFTARGSSEVQAAGIVAVATRHLEQHKRDEPVEYEPEPPRRESKWRQWWLSTWRDHMVALLVVVVGVPLTILATVVGGIILFDITGQAP